MSIRSIRVSHIVLTTKELAELMLENLRSCDTPELLARTFERLAKKYSACGTRNKGGDLGYIEYNTSAPELERAAMETPLGELGGPVKSKFGYHVFLITEEERMGDTGSDGISLPLGAGPGTL